MDISDNWKRALASTEIIRSRVQGLMTLSDTSVPYVLLCESSVNEGDTVVRKGEVIVHRPSLLIPPNNPQFSGFDLDKGKNLSDDSLVNFLLIRGVTIPSMYYNNQTSSLDIYEGSLSKAIKEYTELFQQEENVTTGLITGLQDCWPFSLLIFICSQIARNADQDIRRLLKEFHKKGQN